jgi:DNA-binding FrmR family transcriptional regulator
MHMVTARYAKTEKGRAEIADRQRKLRGKLRTVLFLVDPGKPLDEIRQQAAQIGAPADAITQLVAEGYIAEIGAGAPAVAAAADVPTDELERFRAAKAFMNDTIVDALGIRAFLFTMRLERCATRTDLAALLPDYAAALAKKREAPEADVLIRRTREMVIAA